MKPNDSRVCLGCRHFKHAPLEIEGAFPGLWSLSSAYAAVRGNDGLCEVHERYVTAASTCGAYADRTPSYEAACDEAFE
jgi:hypothetical protein